MTFLDEKHPWVGKNNVRDDADDGDDFDGDDDDDGDDVDDAMTSTDTNDDRQQDSFPQSELWKLIFVNKRSPSIAIN